MYKKHPVFDTPDDDKKIWRYLDLTKLLDILYRQKLYFPRTDLLGDPYEGSYPKTNIDSRNIKLAKLIKSDIFQNLSYQDRTKAEKKFNRDWRKYFGISCWCMSEDESAALWQIYCGSSYGVAIQSTIGRLKKSLEEEREDVYIGRVNYIDYLTEEIPELNKMYPLVYKRASYAHENELRLVISLPIVEIENNTIKKIRKMKGHYIKINIDELIENVFIAPESEKWQKEIVQSVLSRYGLKRKVKHSDLIRKPLF